MAFQFQCPQGHLLQAEPTQVGEQSQCPMCGETFFIPAPAGAEPEAAPNLQFGPAGHASAPPEPEPFPFAPQQGPTVDPFSQPGPQLLHIPCPKGHELEVPPDMIGQDVMCPHCRVQFRLREKDSVEHKRRQQEQLALKDHKAGKTWIMWAVIFAILVLSGLIAMIATGMGQ